MSQANRAARGVREEFAKYLEISRNAFCPQFGVQMFTKSNFEFTQPLTDHNFKFDRLVVLKLLN